MAIKIEDAIIKKVTKNRDQEITEVKWCVGGYAIIIGTEVKKSRRRPEITYKFTQKGEELIEGIITQDDQTDKLVEFAEVFGIFLVDLDYRGRIGRRRDGISTSQIRNIFGEVRQIEMERKSNPEASWVRLQLLRPKLAYTAKKANKDRAIIFSEVLSTAILNIESKDENFKRFVNLFEAILAYHRAHGGR